MRRIILLACTAAVVLLCPASSLAGTFTWTQPADFTATPPGSNPDHDRYGRLPWSYVESQRSSDAPSHDPRAFQPLSRFATGVKGGLVAWTDASDPSTFVGVNATGSPIMSGGDTFAAGEAVLEPAPDRLVAIGWTSPLAGKSVVQVTGAVVPNQSAGCSSAPIRWTLDQDGHELQSGTSKGAISATPTVSPGAGIYLTVAPGAGVARDPACGATAVVLQIQAAQSAAPALTLDTPASGSLLRGGQPVFSGSAGRGFGVSGRVTVGVYSGSSATGARLQTLTATASSGAYAVSPNPGLPDGEYTAQAEQDDLSRPPDAGFSAPVTFVVSNAPPSIGLSPAPSAPFRTTTPSLAGTAMAGSGGAPIALLVYSGSTTTSTPVRVLAGTVGSGGGYSIPIAPGLDDGRYTAVAVQSFTGTFATSPPTSFRIKVHPPAVTLGQPAAGASTSDSTPLFSGVAGTALGDAGVVRVNVYRGRAAAGRPIGMITVATRRSGWSGRLPFKLGIGVYTTRAQQMDDAGNVGSSRSHTFRILRVVGTSVTLDRRGVASVPVTCFAPQGAACRGTVLILTVRAFQPVAGGPSGPLRVLFAQVSIPGGETRLVQRPAPATVASALRHRTLQVKVRAVLREPRGRVKLLAGLRILRAR